MTALPRFRLVAFKVIFEVESGEIKLWIERNTVVHREVFPAMTLRLVRLSSDVRPLQV
jgi:hypothetical protein